MNAHGFQAKVVETHGEPPAALVFTGGLVVARGVLNGAGFLAERVAPQALYPADAVDEMNEVAERAAKEWREENATRPVCA